MPMQHRRHREPPLALTAIQVEVGLTPVEAAGQAHADTSASISLGPVPWRPRS